MSKQPETTLVPVDDRETLEIVNYATGILQDVQNLAVIIPEGATVSEKLDIYDRAIAVATDMVGYIGDVLKRGEERKKFFVTPIKQQVKRIEEWFAEQLKPLKEADALAREKWLKFKQERKTIRLAEEVRLRQLQEKEQAKLERQAAKKGLPAPPPLPIPVVAPDVTSVEGAFGAVGTRKTWTCRVVDFSQVPEEFKTLDTVKVNQAIRAGAREIPGLEIYQEEIVTRQ
ncbi:MAG: hypothetical protein C4521_07725 [Actinobacteria bacterium]|nr:MAG: hypothetical protein C4521_07725 [Actinomycetota bacterium]